MSNPEYSNEHVPQDRPETDISSTLPYGILAGSAIIIISVLLVYYPSLRGGFIFDDDLILTDNYMIKASDGPYHFWFSTTMEYYPITYTMYWIEWRVWGMNPTGYRIVNLIIHITNALLIWFILRKMSIPGAFLAALIFALHPVNVDSVAWIAQQKNLMALFFLLLSILCYLKLEIPCPLSPVPCSLFYWLSLLAFVSAMFSKGLAAVLPALLLGIIWWLRPLTRWDLVRTAPFFAIAAALSLVNVWMQMYGNGEIIVVRTAGFVERLLGAGGVVWFYLYKALLPFDLTFVYPLWQIKVGNPLWWLPLMAALAVTAVLWRRRKGWSRPLLFAWGFFCVALVPVMGLADIGFMQYSLVADHYQHIAIIGVIALAAAGFGAWRQRAQGKAVFTAVAIVMAAVGTLAFLTFRQSRLYGNPILLYQANLDKNPDCSLAHNNLGIALVDAGRLQEAGKHYRRVLQLRPADPAANYNMGRLLVDEGRLPEAIEHFREAIKSNPRFAEAYNNLGSALLHSGRVREAISNIEQALRINPYFPEACNNMGIALNEAGRPAEAIKHYEQALMLKPNYPEAHNNIAIALNNAGRPEQAIKHFEQALALKPDYPEAHYNLGLALADKGRLQESIEHFKQALRLAPKDAKVCKNLGKAMAAAGQRQEAIKFIEQALALKPDFPEAHYQLGLVLADIGRKQEAIEHFEQALRFNPDYPEANYTLGITLVNIGRVREAIEYFKQVIKLKPDHINAYSNLMLAYAQTDQSAEAVATAQKALEIARSKRQREEAKKIEDWLNSYRAELEVLPSTPHSSK